MKDVIFIGCFMVPSLGIRARDTWLSFSFILWRFVDVLSVIVAKIR